MAFQNTTATYQQDYFVGQVIHNVYSINGNLHIPGGGTTPKSGDPVVWDETQNAYRLPTSAAESAAVVGLIATRKSQGALANGDEIDILVMGTMAVRVGEAVNFNDRIQWQTDDQKWDQIGEPTSVAAVNRAAIRSLTKETAADNGIILASVGILR